MAVAIRAGALPLVVLSSELGHNAVRDAARAGLVQVARGVFTPASDGESVWQRQARFAMARVVGAARRTGGRAVFSHRTAALVHGLWTIDDDDEVHTTQRTKPSRTTPGLRRHVGDLDPADVTEVNGLRVTTIERTIVDCAKTMHPRDALVVADSGMRALVRPRRDQPQRTKAEAEPLRSRLLAMVEDGSPRGRRQARAVIEFADPLSESPYETVVRWIALSRGLPRPVLQLRCTTDGYTDYPDLAWRAKIVEDGREIGELTLLAEYDGEDKYVPDLLDPAAARREISRRIMAERRRQNRLASRPSTRVERFDRSDLADEERVFRRLCAHFPARWVARLRPRPALLGPVRRREVPRLPRRRARR